MLLRLATCDCRGSDSWGDIQFPKVDEDSEIPFFVKKNFISLKLELRPKSEQTAVEMTAIINSNNRLSFRDKVCL